MIEEKDIVPLERCHWCGTERSEQSESAPKKKRTAAGAHCLLARAGGPRPLSGGARDDS